MKLDILGIFAHPDDAELGCGGTLARHTAEGKKVGVADLTQGELGTRGTADTRREETAHATEILKLSVRENLGLPDGFFRNDEASQYAVIRLIRKYQPDIVIANCIRDRHPDHARAAQLVVDAAFLAGLPKVISHLPDGTAQTAWRPKNVFHIIQSDYIDPDFIVDISNFWELKMAAVLAYQTQFHTPKNIAGSQTFISSPEFLQFLQGRAREFGQAIRVLYGEGFTSAKKIGVNSLFDVL